jgi:hypothetical protein
MSRKSEEQAIETNTGDKASDRVKKAEEKESRKRKSVSGLPGVSRPTVNDNAFGGELGKYLNLQLGQELRCGPYTITWLPTQKVLQ